MNKQLVRFMFNLEELIESSKEIYIIGHNDPDHDAIGAALGVAELCHVLNKKSKIIMNEDKFTLQPSVKLLQDMNSNRKFINLDEYNKELEKKVFKKENTYLALIIGIILVKLIRLIPILKTLVGAFALFYGLGLIYNYFKAREN